MDAKERNVFTEIVVRDLCIGCGLCAGVCPTGHLSMGPDDFGQYVAGETQQPCSDRCDLCLRVCPFSDQPEDEDVLARCQFGDVPDVRHTKETGYYLQACLGYSNVDGHRSDGASGGIATWLLEALLAENIVDAAVCVTPTAEVGRLFEFSVCRSAEEVRRGARSCYYPVEMSQAVRFMLDNPGRYALTALPCYAKALCRAMEHLPRLKERIRCVLGLVCGQYKSQFLAEYLCGLAGGDPKRLRQVQFRLKSPGRSTADAATRLVWTGENGQAHEGTLHNSEWVPSTLWSDCYFVPNACFFCDDVFAECADAALMDAWLPPYWEDDRGHNIILLRSPLVEDLVRRGAARGDLKMEPVDASDVIRSQRPALKWKRGAICQWIRLAEAEGGAVPRKRTGLLRDGSMSYWERKLAGYQRRIALLSRREWPLSGRSVSTFRGRMARLAAKARFARRAAIAMQRPLEVPAALLHLLRKHLGRKQ